MLPRVSPRRCSLQAALLAIIACALPWVGHAQATGAVTGTVTRTDGQPLAEVMVTIQSTGRAVATNATGRYNLQRVPLGAQVLLFRLIGYAPDTITVTVVAEQPTTADVTLKVRPILLGDVVVQGVSRAPDRMIDAPAAVSVVQPTTGEPVSLTGQIPLAMARMPGLDVAQSGINDFNVNARGFNKILNGRMLVLQDGRDLGTLYVIRETWALLSQPLEDMGRIEVIRGPGSALYGANAFSGVINITTPAAREIVGTKLTLGGGELGTMRADLRQAGVWHDGRFGYRVNLGYRQSEDWSLSRTAKDRSDWKDEYAAATDDTLPRLPRPDSMPLIGQTKDPVTGAALGTPDPMVAVYGSARLDYYALNGSMVTLEGGGAQEENPVTVVGSGRNQAPKYMRPWARLAWNGSGSTLSAWYGGLSLPDDNIRLSSGQTMRSNESAFHLEGHTSRTFHGNGGRVVVGASIQDNNVNTYGTALPLAQDARHDQYYGVFGQLEYRIGHVRAIGAVRWDESDLYPAQFSPKGALVYTLAPNHALHLGVNRAFGTPSLANLFQDAPTGNGVQNLSALEAQLRADPVVGPLITPAVPNGTLFTKSDSVSARSLGNPDLVPGSVMSYEAGYKGQVGWRAFITLDTYFAHIKNFVSTALPGINPTYSHWAAPPEVADADRDAVESGVRNAFNAAYPDRANALTRLPDGRTAVVLSPGNVGTVDEWGVELGSSVSLTRTLTLSVSYTWYQYAIRDSAAGDVVSPNTPQHKGTVALEYAGRQGITLGVDARIVEGYYWASGTYAGDIPTSQTVNLHAGWRVNPHLRVYANATNLLDQQRFHVYGGSVNGRRVLVGMTSTF